MIIFLHHNSSNNKDKINTRNAEKRLSMQHISVGTQYLPKGDILRMRV